MNNKKINDIGLFLQTLCCIIVLAFAIMSLFVKELLIVAEVFMAGLMFLFAHNNERIYRRKGFSLIYTIAGVVILIMVIAGLFL